MIEIITERTVWNANIKLTRHSDFYHTYFYHNLSKKENETPILIKYKDHDAFVLLPLLVREIENTDYKDATSVYGYAGILCSSDIVDVDKEKFKKELKQYFIENKIVSVFSRLHPFLECQSDILDGIGVISNPGDVVYINLLDSLDIQRKNYRKRLKTHVNKTRRFCNIISGESEAHVQTFIDIYYENMRRVDANEDYFFEEDYFYKLLASPDFETELSLAVCNETNEIIAGALFIKTNNIVQYHLSGIREDFLHLNPIKLIIDDMRIKATKEGYTYLNLGGGRSNQKDSLFNFKRSFSKNLKPFKLWKCICNKEAYKNLVLRQKQLDGDVNLDSDEEYFPAYRRILTQ
jgi:hypothetical protein